METILKVGCERIMRVFYKEKFKNIHLREIARMTKMNENSTTRFLKMLEGGGMLESFKEGNLKKYSIKKGKKIFSLFSLFDSIEFEKLPSKIKRAIEMFYSKLAEKPIFLVLFGSFAKGNFREESDIDLLSVFNKKINTNTAEAYSEAQTGVRISCIAIDYGSFLRELKIKDDKVIASAVNSGYPVLNHIKYYEEVLK